MRNLIFIGLFILSGCASPVLAYKGKYPDGVLTYKCPVNYRIVVREDGDTLKTGDTFRLNDINYNRMEAKCHKLPKADQ